MIYLGADHGGFQLKKFLTTYLTKTLKKEVEDLGAHASEPTDDYPDFAFAVARKVADSNEKDIGILLCRSGLGMAIAANKVKGIRAIVGNSILAAELGRKHNHANVLSLDADQLSHEHAMAIVKTFLETPYDMDPRHVRRVEKIMDYEK